MSPETQEEFDLPSVYNFLDARLFLRTYRESRRKQDAGFTNSYICFALGQKNSTSYFNNVIAGRVQIGRTLVERFIKLLAMNKEEAVYFRLLVRYSQCGETEERERLLTKLIAKNRLNCTTTTTKAIPYYQHWSYAVIRALLDLGQYNGTELKELKKRLIAPISEAELRKSLHLLEEIGMIERNEEGYLKPVDAAIAPSLEIQKELLRQYQLMQFKHSQTMMMNSEARPQKVTSMTLSISEDTYNTIKEKIDTLREEIRSLASNDQASSEKLYQFNMHLYPHCKY